ncbi:hypothetical protein M0R72_11685 [Candidatus Pacearchaeota archaeon]|jgi:hypothetical protein|nr:hypothetical protein [Candidatus Pacearchaeota archaeon]
MSLADDMAPEDCIEACAETIEENLKAVLANMPDQNDSPQDAAKKYTILGKCFRAIRNYTKEALKATQMGQDSAAFLLLENKKHRPLDEFADTVEISIDGGSKVKTTLQNFERVTGAVQRDPGLAQEAE